MSEVKDERPPEYLEKLKATIMQTGFPLELEVDDILQSEGWFTQPNTMFLDHDLNQTTQREVDNHAILPQALQSDKHGPIPFSPNLFVECKRLPETYAVVMSQKRKVVTHYDFTGQLNDLRTTSENQASTLAELLFDGVDFHYKKMTEKIGIGKEIKIPKGEEGKDAIFTGSMQLVKGASI